MRVPVECDGKRGSHNGSAGKVGPENPPRNPRWDNVCDEARVEEMEDWVDKHRKNQQVTPQLRGAVENVTQGQHQCLTFLAKTFEDGLSRVNIPALTLHPSPPLPSALCTDNQNPRS